MTAIQFLEVWLIYKKYWTDHNPSVTISVKEDEWAEVGEWVYKNFDEVGGLSFLPFDGGTYTQAPYETSDELPESPQVNYGLLKNYEFDDQHHR